MAATFQQIADQAARVEKARASLARQQERLDVLVAHSVSARPASPTWYLHPGELTTDEARGAAGLTELGLHRTMERYARQRAAETKRRPR